MEFRRYRLMKLTGWGPDEIDDTPAELLDWWLAFEVVEARVRKKAEDRARGAVQGR